MSAAILNVQKCKDTLLPQFLFEWHPVTQKVYMLEIPGQHVGTQFVPASGGTIRTVVIAEHCEDAGKFYGFVQTWCRGYKKAVSDFSKLSESVLLSEIDRITNSGLLKGETDG